MTLQKNKIFILASERSGTNLLRTLIGNHRNINAPIAPHFFNFFVPQIRYYGDLKNKTNSILLLKHFIQTANHSYNNWNLKASPEILYNKYQPTSINEVFDAVYLEHTTNNNKNSYCSKGINTFHYLPLIKEKIPKSKFIYLYRDPRDHVVSWLKTPLFMHTPYQVVSKWNKEQDECIKFLLLYPDSIHTISYESLIKNTEIEMIKLLEFLEEEVDPSCFRTSTKNTEASRNELWKNLTKPIMSDNTKKYTKDLSKKNILIIESIAKENMKFLGYDDFNTKGDWEKEESLLFKMNEKIRDKISRRRHRLFFEEKMKDLNDKFLLQRKILTELKQRY